LTVRKAGIPSGSLSFPEAGIPSHPTFPSDVKRTPIL